MLTFEPQSPCIFKPEKSVTVTLCVVLFTAASQVVTIVDVG